MNILWYQSEQFFITFQITNSRYDTECVIDCKKTLRLMESKSDGIPAVNSGKKRHLKSINLNN